MKKKHTMKKILSLLPFLLLLACNSDTSRLDKYMVAISEFKIDPEILQDGDYVEILGSSGNLREDDKIDFYNLVVVRSERTGDTVNVLLTNYFMADLNNPRTRFLSNTSTIGKLIEKASSLKDIEGKQLENIKPKTFKKVFYDSEYIQVDVRDIPAITGNLGDFSLEEGDISDFDL